MVLFLNSHFGVMTQSVVFQSCFIQKIINFVYLSNFHAYTPKCLAYKNVLFLFAAAMSTKLNIMFHLKFVFFCIICRSKTKIQLCMIINRGKSPPKLLRKCICFFNFSSTPILVCIF